MKLTVLQENLVKVVQDSLRFISNKPQLPILSGISIAGKDNTIIIRSTDLRVGFHTLVRGKVDEEGDCVVPAKTLYDFLSCLHAGPLTIEVTPGQCLISQAKAKATLQTFPSTDFPPFPTITEEPVEIPFESLYSLVDQVSYASSLDETRPILASILFVMNDEGFTCVGTDGYRLAVSSSPIIQNENMRRVLLNAKACTEVMRTLQRYKPEKVRFAVSQELKQVSFSVEDTVILLRLTEGEFPPYTSIIPHSFGMKTFIDREELLQALKTSLIFAKENSSIISVTISNKSCTVTASHSSVGENETVLTSTYEGEETKKISFNAKFLMDALTHIQTERVELCINDELKPVLVLPEGSEYPKNIVMPFKR